MFFFRPGFTTTGSAGTDASFLLQNRNKPAQPGYFHFTMFNGYEPGVGSPPPDPPDPTETHPGIPGALYNKWSSDAGWLTGARMNTVASFQPGVATQAGKSYDGPPRHAILTNEQCTEMYGFEDTSGGTDGEFKAFPSSMQIQFICTPTGPLEANMVTTVSDYFYVGPYWTGGKAIQGFTSNNRGIRFEMKHGFAQYEADGFTLNNCCTQFRVYKADNASIGGTGDNTNLGVAIPGIDPVSNSNIQPGLNHIPAFSGTYAYRRSWTYDYNRDHIYSPSFSPGGVGAFLVKPGKWYRLIVTRDFTDGDGSLANPWRTWAWMESDTDPRTLILADDVNNGFRGFPHNYQQPVQEQIDGSLAEWNNSSTYNVRDYEVRIRDWFIIKDVWGGDL